MKRVLIFLLFTFYIVIVSCNGPKGITGCEGYKMESFYVGLHKIKLYKLTNCEELSLERLQNYPKVQIRDYLIDKWQPLEISDSIFTDLEFELKTAIQVTENKNHVNYMENLITDIYVNQNNYYIAGVYFIGNEGAATQYNSYRVYYVLNNKTKRMISIDNREY